MVKDNYWNFIYTYNVFSDYGYTSSIDLEGILVDTAIDNVMNLPQAFNEVVEMQKDQSNEIQRQQLILKNMQVYMYVVLQKNIGFPIHPTVYYYEKLCSKFNTRPTYRYMWILSINIP